MALLAALLSTVFAAAKDLVSKRLASQLDGLVSTFASFAFALPYYVLVLAFLFFFTDEPFDYSLSFLLLVFLRSVTDTFAEAMKMYAFAYGDISLVASFFSLSPLILLVTSPLITGDELTTSGIVAVGLVVCGSLILVYRPTATDWASQKKGIWLALGAALFFSLNSCFDRLAVKQETAQALGFVKPVLAGFAMTLCSTAFLVPFMVRSADHRKTLHVYWGEFALRGFLEVTFMASKLFAMQTLQAPYVVGIQRISLLLSIIGGRVFFNEQEFGKRLLAGACILAGVVLIAWSQL